MAAESLNGSAFSTEIGRIPESSSKTNTIQEQKENMVEHQNCIDDFTLPWGFNIKELYNLATKFFKEKEGKAFHLKYADKLTLVAFTQQVTHGKFIEEKFPPVGYLDVIGRDRRQMWASLGDMTERDAKSGFINLLDKLCPLFKTFVQAHKCHLEEMERRRKVEEEEKRREEEELEQMRLEEEARVQEEKQKERQMQQRRLIQEALNRQTFHQFKSYAERQCPGSPEQQTVLIRQLQEQHYQQYMNQVLQQQQQEFLKPNRKQTASPQKLNNMANEELSQNCGEVPAIQNCDDTTEEEIDTEQIPAASMWTRKDIQDFKETIRKEGCDSIITVGHGETITVRVPTHNDGSCLSWEFATDSYDLGFGVYFEWTKTPDSQVSVHISESEDDDDEDDDELDHGDIEKAAATSDADKTPLSIIIPVYRRDCHHEVYAGSHVYPGQGVYLLKFDNSYSMLRSKTLYYRVYYTR